MKQFKIIKFVPTVTCGWCGKEIPIIATRPIKCPYCGMTI